MTLGEFSRDYVPLISAVVSLISVSIAFWTLRHVREDRQEQQRAARGDALRREQDALLAALQGEKEGVGFMALQLSREPRLVTDANRVRLFSALCLAFVFESSNRSRALVLKTLQTFYSADSAAHEVIVKILNEVLTDFEAYEEIEPDELKEYVNRIVKLKHRLEVTAQSNEPELPTRNN